MPRLALIKDERYKDHDPGEGHPENAGRLAVIHGLIEEEFSSVPLLTPRIATTDELALVHDPLYIRQVAATEGIRSSRLDLDTGLSARSYETARLAAGGLLQAVDAVLDPKASGPSSAFAFVRPPGHHAEGDRGMGFCLFNNVAIAAEYARRRHGLQRVLIIDWDLHHGNGTQRSFYQDPGVLYFSSHQYPHYPGSGNFDQVGSGNGAGYTVNAPFPAGFGDAEYAAVYEGILRPLALEYRPELVLVSAGFDPYIKDPLGGMELTGPGFGTIASIVRAIADEACGGRVVLTLEGGYHPEGLREGVRAVIRTFLQPVVRPVEIPSSHGAGRVIDIIRSHHRPFWRCMK